MRTVQVARMRNSIHNHVGRGKNKPPNATRRRLVNQQGRDKTDRQQREKSDKFEEPGHLPGLDTEPGEMFRGFVNVNPRKTALGGTCHPSWRPFFGYLA